VALFESWISLFGVPDCIMSDREGQAVHFTVAAELLYVCDVYLFMSFCYGLPLKGMRANNGFRKGPCCVTKVSVVPMRPQDRIPQSH
jgi:hypothetical protein